VRGAAIEALAGLEAREAAARVPLLLDDSDLAVRRAAAAAAGKLQATAAAGKLLELLRDADLPLRSACLDSLRQLRNPQAVPAAVTELEQPATQLAALDYLAEFGGPEQAEALVRLLASSRSHEHLAAAAAALAAWLQKSPHDSPQRAKLAQSMARLQGACGVVLCWYVQGEANQEAATKRATEIAEFNRRAEGNVVVPNRTAADARIELNRPDASTAAAWVAGADIEAGEATKVEFLGSAAGSWQVWLNGRRVHQHEKPGKYQEDSDRFEAELAAGNNRLVVMVAGERLQLHVRFRRLSASAEHERLIRLALASGGNVERGREVFQNAEKSLCSKCHRLGERGEKIGPELTGLGDRISRIHLIESILDPSRAIAPSYETVAVALANGRIVAGVRVAEDGQVLTLADDQGKRHEIAKEQIEERHVQPKSTMPEGLEKRLNDRELLDLLAFLLAQKKP
jgi:putative heme-binding domain-containing protein